MLKGISSLKWLVVIHFYLLCRYDFFEKINALIIFRQYFVPLMAHLIIVFFCLNGYVLVFLNGQQ